MEKINIVLADDHQIVLDGLTFMLSGESQVNIVKKCTNTNDTLAYLEEDPTVHFLISDINMPSVSGIELCRQVKLKYPNVKVLILSMYNSKEMIREALLAEADGYMLKNGGKDKLVEAIMKISNDGTYFSEEILPILMSEFKQLQEKKEEMVSLTDREKEVLIYIAREMNSEEIAQKLFLSIKTIGYHRQNLLQKCGCKSSIGLVKYAIKHGIVQA